MERPMGRWLSDLDRLLRGDHTRKEELQAGRVGLPARRLMLLALGLGAVYGAGMGLFAATGGREHAWLHLLSSAAKLPLLFVLTLLVTFPSLYVFAALANSRLRAQETLRLLVASITVMLGVLASFAPVTVFFTLSTDSYRFMLFLNVVFCGLAGLVGLGFLFRAVNLVFRDEAGAAEGRRARRIFRVWLVLFGVVGAQMAWILKPFVGNPQLPFEWVRNSRVSNFFEFVARALTDNWR
jgi:hypothetical protein